MRQHDGGRVKIFERTGDSMGSRLDQITDWAKLAKECGYRLQKMALRGNVSARHLRRHLRKLFGQKPKDWIDAMRMEAASKQLFQGDSVKKTSSDTDFKYRQNFSAFIKRKTGRPPTQQKAGGWIKCPL